MKRFHTLEILPSRETFIKETPFKVFDMIYSRLTVPSIIAILVDQKDTPSINFYMCTPTPQFISITLLWNFRILCNWSQSDGNNFFIIPPYSSITTTLTYLEFQVVDLLLQWFTNANASLKFNFLFHYLLLENFMKFTFSKKLGHVQIPPLFLSHFLYSRDSKIMGFSF